MGDRVPALLEQFAARTEFFAPASAFEEAGHYLPQLAAKRHADPRIWLESLEHLRFAVVPLADEVIAPHRDAALERIRGRDPDDWPSVAAALALACPIWTEDRDFFGSGVATWTSDLLRSISVATEWTGRSLNCGCYIAPLPPDK